ncbi:MAG: T9SS type A sorting domain-containing protein [Chitinophagales bacterium]
MGGVAEAQQVLFTATTRSQIGFTPAQSVKLDTVIANPIYDAHYFVAVNPVVNNQFSGTISVNLPDRNVVCDFLGVNVQYWNSNDFIFYGELVPCDTNEVGSMHLIAKNGNLFGQIDIENDTYDLQDFGNRKNVLFRYDNSFIGEYVCGADDSESHSSTAPTLPATPPEETCEVDVLVIYTPKAAAVVDDPVNRAELAIEQTKQGISNSLVNMKVNLVGVVEVQELVETIDYSGDLNIFSINQQVQALRDLYGADIVIFFTDGDYGKCTWWDVNVVGNSCILGYGNVIWGNNDYGFALVQIDKANYQYTFAHEFAHIFGCRHEIDNLSGPTTVADAKAYQFKIGKLLKKRRRTIVYSGINFTKRVLYYSNPDVTYEGVATGIENERDNAKQLNNAACVIADYRESKQTTNPPPANLPLHVSLTGPTKGKPGCDYTWCVQVENCTNITYMYWQYNIDGFGFTDPMPYNPCFGFTFPNASNYVQIKVTVNCSNGQSETLYRTIIADESLICYDDKRVDTDTKENAVSLLSYSPNPFKEDITIRYKVNKTSNVQITLIDIRGTVVKELVNTQQATGTYEIRQEKSEIPQGIYFLRIQDDNNVAAKLLLKL